MPLIPNQCLITEYGAFQFIGGILTAATVWMVASDLLVSTTLIELEEELQKEGKEHSLIIIIGIAFFTLGFILETVADYYPTAPSLAHENIRKY